MHDRPIETRTDDSVVRVAGGRPHVAAALARLCAGRDPPAGGLRPPPAGLRRRAEEHLRGREGRARLGGPPRGRPRELRDAALVHGRHRPLPAPVRGRARGGGARPASRVPVHEARASSSTASAWSGCSTTTPTWPRAWPSTARPRPAVGAIFDGTGYGEDGTVWGGELLFGDLAGFERAGLLFPVRMPGGEAAIASPGGWPARGWPRRSTSRGARPGSSRGGRRSVVGAGVEARDERARLAAHHERRPALRRRGRALRAARGGQLRGPGGDRARGGAATPPSGAPTRCRCATSAARW